MVLFVFENVHFTLLLLIICCGFRINKKLTLYESNYIEIWILGICDNKRWFSTFTVTLANVQIVLHAALSKSWTNKIGWDFCLEILIKNIFMLLCICLLHGSLTWKTWEKIKSFIPPTMYNIVLLFSRILFYRKLIYLHQPSPDSFPSGLDF